MGVLKTNLGSKRLLARIALAMALGVTCLLATVRWLNPGVPWRLLLRATPTDFAWDDIEDGAIQFREQGGGQLVSLVGSKRSFAGRDASVFYLGNGAVFAGRLLIANMDRAGGSVRVRAFVDYREVKLPSAVDPSGAPLNLSPESLVPSGTRAIFPLELPNLNAGTNDFVVVLQDAQDLASPGAAGTAHPFLPRRIFHYQFDRAGATRSLSPAPPRRSAPAQDCREPGRVLLARDASVAVINCTEGPVTGVFFGASAPLVYEVAPRSVSVYRAETGASLFHVSSPWVPAETAGGLPTSAQGDFLGL